MAQCISKKELEEGDNLVIFMTEGCGLSENIHQILSAVEVDEEKVDKVPEKIIMIKEAKGNDCGKVLDEYGVRECPTFMRIKDGKVIGRVDGVDIEEIKKLVEKDLDGEQNKSEAPQIQE